MATALLLACNDNGGGGQVIAPAGCAPGLPGCPCTASGSCQGRAGEPRLACLDGWCAPAECARGAEGCACYPNGTCDARDGVPMTCAANLCQPTALPEPGQPGGPCHEDAACPEGYDCLAGVCQDPSCPTGQLGCACGPFGACDDYQGRPARCFEDRCQLGGCVAGSAGCTCGEGDACEAGLACQSGLCLAGEGVVLRVDDVRARSCDVILEESDHRVAEARFEAHVRGQSASRSPRWSLSFMAREDTPFGGAVGSLTLAERAPLGHGLSILEATCFDRLGRPLDAPQVSLE